MAFSAISFRMLALTSLESTNCTTIVEGSFQVHALERNLCSSEQMSLRRIGLCCCCVSASISPEAPCTHSCEGDFALKKASRTRASCWRIAALCSSKAAHAVILLVHPPKFCRKIYAREEPTASRQKYKFWRQTSEGRRHERSALQRPTQVARPAASQTPH